MSKRRNKRRPVAVICSTLGTFLLIVMIVACIPITLPKVVGYNLYTVISGSMEPAIPTGSLVYVKYTDPKNLEKDDVIAFYGARDGASIITHRVVSNSIVTAELITKGDANEANDMNPVPYNNVIGKVTYSVPMIGGIVQTVTTGDGRFAIAGVFGLAVIFEILGAVLGTRKE